MQLEAGKYYQTRDCRTVGPLIVDSEGGFSVEEGLDGYIPIWTGDGKCDFFDLAAKNELHTDYDLVEEV